MVRKYSNAMAKCLERLRVSRLSYIHQLLGRGCGKQSVLDRP